MVTKMGIDNYITLAVGFLLFITGFITKKRTGVYDWLYIILGFVIICIGILRALGLINLN